MSCAVRDTESGAKCPGFVDSGPVAVARSDGLRGVGRRRDVARRGGVIQVVYLACFDDLEAVAILVVEGEHGWHARPAEELADVDAAGL